MSILYVKCPATGKDIPTELEMTKEAFKTADISPQPVRCPYCERDHTWYKSDAFLKQQRAAS